MDTTPLINVFPCRVETPDGIWSAARVVVTADHAWAFVSMPGGITLVAQGDASMDQEHARGGGPWTFVVDDGLWSVAQQGGCGCGNPLKRAIDLNHLPAALVS